MKTIIGYIHKKKILKTIQFIEIRNREEIILATIEKTNPKMWKSMSKLPNETIVKIEGTEKQSISKKYKKEIEIEKIEVINTPIETLPIDISIENTPYNMSNKLTYRYIDIRKPQNTLIFKMWNIIDESFCVYLRENGFLQIHTPRLMSEQSEGGSEVFEVKYFNKKAYLAQSPQFYKQMAIASGMEKVFDVGPAFRAEKSNTIRHATEFTSYDLEMSNITDIEQLIQFEEKLLIHIFSTVKKTLENEISILYKTDIAIPTQPFPRIPFREVKNILKKMGVTSEDINDISPIEEREIGKYVKEKYNHDFVFITHYPIEKRPFYHMREEKLTKSYDLIYRGIEITTSSIREHRYEKLIEQAIQKGVGLTGIQDYLNFFKHGIPPHGGMALGVERIIMKMLALKNIRDVQFVFRGPNRLSP